MPVQRELDIQAFLNAHPFSAFQWRVWALCFFVLILDGFDVVIMGFIAPVLLLTWASASPQSLAFVLSAGLVGLAVGALVSGHLADRFGRRGVIVVSVLFFGVMSLASSMASNIDCLALLRFMTGLGLGASQPNAATLASEYAPRKYRSLMVTTVYCGFAIGAAGCGFLASALLVDFSWRWMLIIGGLVPIAYGLMLYWMLPESAKYLAARGQAHNKIAAILNRISPTTADGNRWTISSKHTQPIQGVIAPLLSTVHWKTTLLLWTGFFMNLLTAYFLNGWLPVLMSYRGLDVSDSALVGAMFQAGGIAGIVVIGWEMDRLKSHAVLSATLVAAAVLTLAVAHASLGMNGLCASVFLLGYCINSCNTGWTALAVAYYPTSIRATGLGWMTGVGRFGAVAGASAGGVLLGMHWPQKDLITLLVVPMIIAAMAAWTTGRLAVGGSVRAVPSGRNQ